MIQCKKRKGFTLIELLVVISIISLMSSVVLASLTSAKSKANIAKVQSDMNEIKNAAQLFYEDHGQYPVAPTYSINDLVSNNYMKSIPTIPFGGSYSTDIETSTSYCGSETPEIGRFFVKFMPLSLSTDKLKIVYCSLICITQYCSD
jgi:general secretion pathway protein G